MTTTTLRSDVERLSGLPPVVASPQSLAHLLGYDTASMRAAGHDPGIVAEHECFNQAVHRALGHAELAEYLSALTPREVYSTSGVRLLALAGIRDEIQRFAPSAVLFPFGYVPIATSIGGHAVLVSVTDGLVVWADHSVFAPDGIFPIDADTFEPVPLTAESVRRFLHVLAPTLDTFLRLLFDGSLESRLEALDGGGPLPTDPAPGQAV